MSIEFAILITTSTNHRNSESVVLESSAKPNLGCCQSGSQDLVWQKIQEPLTKDNSWSSFLLDGHPWNSISTFELLFQWKLFRRCEPYYKILLNLFIKCWVGFIAANHRMMTPRRSVFLRGMGFDILHYRARAWFGRRFKNHWLLTRVVGTRWNEGLWEHQVMGQTGTVYMQTVMKNSSNGDYPESVVLESFAKPSSIWQKIQEPLTQDNHH